MTLQGIDARSSGEMEELLANLTTNLCVWMEYEFAAAHAVHAAARLLALLCSCTLVRAIERWNGCRRRKCAPRRRSSARRSVRRVQIGAPGDGETSLLVTPSGLFAVRV